MLQIGASVSAHDDQIHLLRAGEIDDLLKWHVMLDGHV
jgi:hypothetical protein